MKYFASPIIFLYLKLFCFFWLGRIICLPVCHTEHESYIALGKDALTNRCTNVVSTKIIKIPAAKHINMEQLCMLGS